MIYQLYPRFAEEQHLNDVNLANKCNNQTGSTLVLQTTLLPILQVPKNLKSLYSKNCDN